MALTLLRVDGPITLTPGGSTAYTGYSGDGTAGDLKYAYYGLVLYRVSGSPVNVTGLGWAEADNGDAALTAAGNGNWYVNRRWRVAIPSSDPLATLPASVLEGYMFVAVFKHDDEWIQISDAGDNEQTVDPLTFTEVIYDPLDNGAPGDPILLAAPMAWFVYDGSFGTYTFTPDFGGGAEPGATTDDITTIDDSVTLSDTFVMSVRVGMAYTDMTDNFNYALDFQVIQDTDSTTDTDILGVEDWVIRGNNITSIVDDDGGDQGFDEYWDVLSSSGSSNDPDALGPHGETHETDGADAVHGAWAFEQDFNTPLLTWVAQHGLDGYPRVTTLFPPDPRYVDLTVPGPFNDAAVGLPPNGTGDDELASEVVNSWRRVEADVEYTSRDTVVLTFSAPQTGKVVLS